MRFNFTPLLDKERGRGEVYLNVDKNIAVFILVQYTRGGGTGDEPPPPTKKKVEERKIIYK